MSWGAIDDGGKKSLIGYLFQMLETATLVYPGDEVTPSDDVEGGLEFFSFVTTETLEDATNEVVTKNGDVATKIVQYKFSSEPSKVSNRIGCPEMFKICMKLAEARDWLEEAYERAASVVLVTNRSLIDDVKTMLADAQSGDGKNNPNIFCTRRGTPTNQKYLSILQDLEVRPHDILAAEESLNAFARDYGVLPCEFESASNHVVMEIMKMATSLPKPFRAFNKDTLVGWMIGETGCCSLRSNGPLAAMKSQEENFSYRQNLPAQLLPRERIIQECLGSGDPVVHLCGEGGTGKSAVLAAILRARLKTPPFFGIERAARLSHQWPAEVVSALRHVCREQYLAEPPPRACSRLAGITGSDTSLWLMIDAYDEDTDPATKRELSRVVDFVLKEHRTGYAKSKIPVRLIVTGRDEKEFLRWFIDDSGTRDSCNAIKSIHMELYQPVDFVNLPSDYCSPRLMSLLSDASRQYSSFELTASEHRSRMPLDLVQRDIFDALRHPALFGRLVELERESAQLAVDAVQGKQNGVAALGRAYISWFASKVEKRSPEIGPDVTKHVVAEVWAKRPEMNRKYARNTDWYQLNIQSEEARTLRKLYAEALSAGIILDESGPPPHWRWRNRFVCEGLRAVCEAEGIQQ